MNKYIGKNGDKYTKGQKIGQGGQGLIYECIHDKLKNIVIKICKKEKKKEKKRFIQEINSLINLNKLGIIGIMKVIDYSVEESKGLWYIMPKLNSKYNEKFYTREIDILKKIDFLIELGIIIKNIHEQKYAHRDIKPANILYDNKNIVLSDFGLAYSEDTERTTLINEKLGPYSFMDPIMNANVNELNEFRPADIFSYGQIAYCVFYNKDYGLGASYHRSKNGNLLYKNEYLEPIYQFLEKTTISDPSIRISIKEALEILEDLKKIIDRNEKVLEKWKKKEIDNKIEQEVDEDYKCFENEEKIIYLINILKKDFRLNIENIKNCEILEITKDNISYKLDIKITKVCTCRCFIKSIKKTSDNRYLLQFEKFIINNAEDYMDYKKYYIPLGKELIINEEIEGEMK